MPTFGQLKTRVSARLFDAANTAVSLSEVGDAINRAIQFSNADKYYFNSADITLTMVTGNPYVLEYGTTPPAGYETAPVLPSNFGFEDEEGGFVIRYNNLRYDIKKRDPRTYDNQFTNGLGIPSIYTWRNGRYEFYYIPNVNYPLYVNYIKDYTDLVNDADSNDWTNEGQWVITNRAVAFLLRDLRADDERADRFEKSAQDEANSLMLVSGELRGSGSLTVQTIL